MEGTVSRLGILFVSKLEPTPQLIKGYLNCSDSDSIHLFDNKKADSAGTKILNIQNMIFENQYVFINDIFTVII